MTVLEAIQLSADYLNKKEIESPRLNAELLLSEVLKCRRFDLYLMHDRPLKDDEVILYREYLKRRGQYEPLQYIIGTVEFYGLNFKVNKNVLIPRQETEVLIEIVANSLPRDNNAKILDIGTGTGNIPICLAKQFAAANFVSVDVNDQAIKLAEENAQMNNVAERISFIHADITKTSLDDLNKFKAIISNPPYVSLDEYQGLQPEIKVYEPMNSVTDYADGYKFYRLICEKAKTLLEPGGYLFFELGEGQYKNVAGIMEANNFSEINVKKDYLNIERVIYGVLS